MESGCCYNLNLYCHADGGNKTSNSAHSFVRPSLVKDRLSVRPDPCQWGDWAWSRESRDAVSFQIGFCVESPQGSGVPVSGRRFCGSGPRPGVTGQQPQEPLHIQDVPHTLDLLLYDRTIPNLTAPPGTLPAPCSPPCPFLDTLKTGWFSTVAPIPNPRAHT